MTPMAGASPVSLASAVTNAGEIGACGVVLSSPEAIRSWAEEFRQQSDGSFHMNLWILGPALLRNAVAEDRQRVFLGAWGPAVPASAAHAPPEDFEAQGRAVLQTKPKVISSIMGLFPPSLAAEMKAQGTLWLATASNVPEARAAKAAGADAIVAQGAKGGRHRGAFDAHLAETQSVGLFVEKAIRTRHVAAAEDAPPPAPYPIQRALTPRMRGEARAMDGPERMQMWAGQAAKYARAEPAATLVRTLWDDAFARLS